MNTLVVARTYLSSFQDSVARSRTRGSQCLLIAVLALASQIAGSAQAPTAPEPLLVVANGVAVIDFGEQPINVLTPPKAVLIQNAGNATLAVSGVDLAGVDAADFVVANNGCGTLPPGGACSITVQFRPSVAAARSARLRVFDNASGSPQIIPLGGTGSDPSVRQKIVGPVDPRHGYPMSVTDQNGLTLGLCWDDPTMCLTVLPDLTKPPLVSDEAVNFPDESFWYAAEASIEPWSLGKRALLVLAQEAAFTSAMVPGGQAMFGRIRIRVDGLVPNTTYRITHPYGRDFITTDDAGEIFTTEDIGCLAAPCDYNLIKTSRVWPFLTWDPAVAPAAPAGFIGDPTVLHRVVGSPIGQNVFRIEQVVGGGFQLIGQTNLFTVSGKLVSAPPPVTPTPSTAIVPDVLTIPQADAQAAITSAGLTVGSVATQNSALTAGRVLSQNPLGGVTVPSGTAVALVVSLGPANVTVPSVVGSARAAAQTDITNAGFTVGGVTNQNSATVAAGLVISQNPAGGTSAAPGTAVALVVSLGPALVTVPAVVNLAQAAAQSALTGAGLAVGAITNATSATVIAGSIISQTPSAGTAVPAGSAVSLVVSSGPAAAGAPVAQVSVSVDGAGTRTTPAFSTTEPGEVLIALVASDGPPTGTNSQNLTISGGGLTWTRVQRAATARGVAEIWAATASGVLTGVTVTSTQSLPVVLGAPVNQSLHVVAFTNASAVGASAIASGTTGAPRVSMLTQAAGSGIYGVGIDFDRAVARTVPVGQTKIHEFLAPSGDTMWMQSLNAASGAAGQSVTLNDTAPTTDQWNFAIVEVKR